MDKAKEIVDEIIKDLTGRKGLENAWYDIDLDIRNEIIDEWRDKINSILKKE